MRPCDDLIVIDLSSGMAGGLASLVLSDAGARVIKVEPPLGDPSRSLPGFLMWHRGQESLVLDLHRPADRATALELISAADVVLESFAPGGADQLGLGYPDVSARHPGLVYASISGAGPASRLAGLAADELLLSAATGRVNGLDELSGRAASTPPGQPVLAAIPTASYGAAMLAAQGVLAALHARTRTGRGQHVETSLLEASTAFLMRQEMPRLPEGTAPDATGELVYAGIKLCFLTVECADGRFLQMCARQDAQFRGWLDVAGLGALLDEPRFDELPLGVRSFDDARELTERLRAAMRTRPAATWLELFSAADVGADPFLLPSEFLAHPQMAATGRVVVIDQPGVGPVRQLGPLVQTGSGPMLTAAPAPALGAHGPLPRPARRGPATSAPATATEDGGPLAGVTIIDAASFIAAPYGATLLAELGARVIKVEPPDGDPYRRTGLQALKFQQGKQSLAVDLKRPEGSEVLHRLVRRADAIVHNLRPGVPQRLAMDHPTLAACNPRLVYLYASCYGSTGPLAQSAAFHSTPTALSGGGIVQAGAGNLPVDDSYPDPGSALAVAVALLLGLRHQQRTGTGCYLETTMLCSAGYSLSNELVDYPGRPPTVHPTQDQLGLGPLRRLYRGQDGWLYLSAPDERWGDIARSLGQAAWSDDARLADSAPAPDRDPARGAALAGLFATAPVATWVDALGRAGVDAATVPAVELDRWLVAEGLALPKDSARFGPYWSPGPKVRLSEHPTVVGDAPTIGEDSRSLLGELGYASGEVEELIGSGVVRAS